MKETELNCFWAHLVTESPDYSVIGTALEMVVTCVLLLAVTHLGIKCHLAMLSSPCRVLATKAQRVLHFSALFSLSLTLSVYVS